MKRRTLGVLLLSLAPATAHGQLMPPSPWQPTPQPQPQNRPQQPSATEQKLREAEAKDSGRGLEWFFLTPEVGVLHMGVQTLSAGSPAPFRGPSEVGAKAGSFEAPSTTGTGPVVGAAIGGRLYVFTLGVRGRLAWLGDYNYVTIDPEIGMHIPLGNLEPSFFVGGGYSMLLGFKKGPDGMAASGFNVRLGGALDYYLSPNFSIGGLLTFDLARLSHSASSLAGGYDGAGLGLGVAATLVAGLHF